MLVHKELTGELTPSEGEELNTLRKTLDTNKLTEDISLIWNVSKDYFPSQDWNTGSAKAQFLNNIRTEKATSTSKSVVKSERKPSPLLKFALGIIGLSMIALLAYNFLKETKEIKADTTIEYAILDDATKVWLGEGSTLSAIEIDKRERTVALEGVAFFDVTHNPQIPFTIDLGNGIRAEVLGTSFKIESTHENGTGMVSVRDGKVRLYNTSNSVHNLILTKGQTGILNPSTELINTTNTEGSLTLGVITDLALMNLPLEQAFDKLADFYGVDIVTANADLTDCKFSSSLNGDPTLSEIFTSILEVHTSLDIKLEKRSLYKVSGTCD